MLHPAVRYVLRTASVRLAVLAVTAVFGSTRADPILYTVTPLVGFFPAGSSSALNDLGQVAGYSNGSAAIWSNSNIITIGPPNSTAIAINNLGEVAGDGPSTGFLYSNGTIMDFGPGGVAGMNNLGQVVGIDYLYSNGALTGLSFAATAINDLGRSSEFPDRRWPHRLPFFTATARWWTSIP